MKNETAIFGTIALCGFIAAVLLLCLLFTAFGNSLIDEAQRFARSFGRKSDIPVPQICEAYKAFESLISNEKRPVVVATGLTKCSVKENEMADGSVAGVEYRVVPDFPLYRVGSDGTVWTLNRKFCKEPSTEWMQMKCKTQSRGYKQVRLHRKGGESSLCFVHRLVLEMFVGPCPRGMEACHFPNPDKTCNRLDNLRWDTSKANKEDARHQGRLNYSSDMPVEMMPNAKINHEIAAAIRHEFAVSSTTITELGDKYSMTSVNVSDILRGRIWKNSGGPIVQNVRRPRRRCA